MRIDIIKTLTKPMTEPEWIIEKVIPRGSFIFLAGEAGAGKTVLSQHIAICGAAQLPFLGAYPTHQTKTLYIDEENGLPDLERYWQRTYHG